MKPPPSSATHEADLVFLVERYLPVTAVDGLAASVARVARLCLRGESVRYLQSVFLPSDDTCFCIFQAASADAVHAVNAAGRFPVDRITRAIPLPTHLQ